MCARAAVVEDEKRTKVGMEKMKPGSPKVDEQTEPPTPPGHFTFFFTEIVPVIRLANTRRLDQVNLPGLFVVDEAGVQYDKFRSNYVEKQLVGASILPFIRRLLIVGALLYGVNVATLYVGPLVLQYFLYLIQDEQRCVLAREEEAAGGPAAPPCESRLWFGYVLAAILLVSKVIGSFCLSHSEMLMTRAALRSRSAIMSALFRKCLRLAGVQETSTGQIQTLMSIDAEVVLMMAPVFNMLWSAPIQVIITLTWLGFIIGPALGVSVAMLVLFVPLQGKVTKALLRLRGEQLRLTDQRVKITNELVQGMRVVKLCGWEPTMREKLLAIRDKELDKVRRQRYIAAFFSTLLVAQPVFVAVGTFTAYVGFGNSLTAPRVITALALLTQLRFPLVFLPFIIIQSLNLRISLARVNRFLKNKEIAQSRQQPALRNGAASDDASMLVAEGAGAEAADGDADSGTKSGRSAVSLRGSFAWMPPEVPPPRKGKGGGKGTGKSAGGRGKGAPAATEDLSTRSTRSVGGRGGARSDKAGRFVPRMNRTGTASVPLDGGVKASPLDSLPVEQPPAAAERKVKPTLVDIQLSLAAGSLTMIAGSVGSGKSSVLAALLGEMVAHDDADFSIDGTVAYAAQTPFIASDTVRANILFGGAMDEKWYHRVVEACALASDLNMLPGGDMTQIGEKGINVSGGQKARIALARAVYSRADVYLLDDPLSAVDAHVGKHLFQHVIGPDGLLAGKTRVLVTHQTQYLPLADDVVLIESGSVMMRGHFDELRQSEHAGDFPALSGLLEDVSTAEDIRVSLVEDAPPVDSAAPEPPTAPPSDPPSEPASGPPSKPASQRDEEVDIEATTTGGVIAAGNAKQNDSGARLVQLEERQTGAIDRKVFEAYIRAAGGKKLVVVAVLLCCLDRGLTTFTDMWLAYWIEGRFANPENFGFWIPIYVGLAFVASFAVYGRSVYTMVVLGVTAAKRLHVQLLDAVLRAPTSFFETTPSGRILNRFTSDTEMCDNTLLQNLQQWINCVLPIVSTLVIISVINPIFVPWLLFLFIFYVALYRHSVSATRDMQRLNQVSRSPIFSQFSETLSGLTTIRSFGAGPRFEAISESLVNANTRCAYSQYLLTNWVTLFLDLMAASIVFFAALFPIIALESGWAISISLVGLSLNYSFELSSFLKHATRMTLEVQKSFAGIERIVEYITHVPSERQGGDEPPAGHWPSAGAIEVRNLAVRYRPELPLVLRAVSCTIPPKAKVGIVGRTGSGKSTFLSSIWRLIEAEGGINGTGAGAIRIDGVDISTLNLPGLRSRLAIIPQDPVLFNDSVRYNLDPFNTASDAELHEVLSMVQLSDAVAALPGTLEHKVSEGGANFSVGQRQLLCLARATLRRSMLLALDEATASIDNETDAVLQAAIRRMFADCTVLTIAHRLHTIMDATSIMLFEGGALREYDEPHVLLADPASKFSRLVAKTGAAAPQLREMARAAHEGRSRQADGAAP